MYGGVAGWGHWNRSSQGGGRRWLHAAHDSQLCSSAASSLLNRWLESFASNLSLYLSWTETWQRKPAQLAVGLSPGRGRQLAGSSFPGAALE